MNELTKKVRIFLDEDPAPIGEYEPPVKFLLDTTRLVDGPHTLKVIAHSTDGKEGIRIIPFTVRNGPAITVIGLHENDVVDDKVPVTINAYGSERKDFFIISGSEDPKGIPSWVWMLLIAFVAWGAFYLLHYFKQPG